MNADKLPPLLWPRLFAVAGDRAWPPCSPEEADLLVQAASQHRLLPLLAFATEQLPEVVHAALDRSRAILRVIDTQQQLLLQNLGRLGELFRNEEFILLKGCDYAFRLYSRPSLRPMADIDLLVPRGRLRQFAQRLLSAGFVQHYDTPAGRLESHHEFVFHDNRITVEVHHSFIQRPRHRIDYDALWQRRVSHRTPVVTAARLSDVDALVYHCLSMANEQFSVPLIKYVDLWLMLQPRARLIEAAERAREWRCERALYSTLTQLRRFFPEVDGEELRKARQRLLSPAVREFLDRYVLPAPIQNRGPRNRPLELWRKFWLIDDLWCRLGFLFYHFYALLAGHWLQLRARRP